MIEEKKDEIPPFGGLEELKPKPRTMRVAKIMVNQIISLMISTFGLAQLICPNYPNSYSWRRFMLPGLYVHYSCSNPLNVTGNQILIIFFGTYAFFTFFLWMLYYLLSRPVSQSST